MRKLYFIFLSQFLWLSIIGQNRFVDSISNLIKTSPDTTKVVRLLSICRYYEYNDPNKAIIFADSALKLAIKIDYKKGISSSYQYKGSCLTTAGNYNEAIESLLLALKSFNDINYQRGVANTYNSLANIYININEEKKAYEYYLKANQISSEEKGLEDMVAVTNVGLGSYFVMQNNSKDAIECFKKAETYFHDIKNKDNEAVCLVNIGEAYLTDSNFVLAEKYFLRSVSMFTETKNNYGLSATLLRLAEIEKHKRNYSKAIEFYKTALEINFERKAVNDIGNSALGLSQTYELNKNFGESLKYLKIYLTYRDSLLNKDKNQAIAEAESKYENEKKEQQLQLKNIELEKSQLEVSQRNILIYVFIFALLIFFILLFFVFRQYKLKKKANIELVNKNTLIENQKSVIEEKNKDITDSINYSKHIQTAILPSESRIKGLLPNSFVVFKPKDIVSGDFYLIEEIAGLIYIAVVDCTGHGVPGAMLSVFADSTIKNSIATNTFRNDPAAILSDLCFQFKNNLLSEKKGTSISDGVDMGMCILDKANKKMTFAGAKNSLFLLRENNILDFAADRWGISGNNSGNQLHFTNHSIELKSNDKFYLTTDGYADQFGGEKGKKFKLKNLKSLILKCQHQSFGEQAQTIITEFQAWKGSLEQIDDITLIGFEI